jgi:hypothetical protein
LVNAQGKIITGREKIIKEATKYYENFYSDNDKNRNRVNENLNVTIENYTREREPTEPFPKILKAEIKHVVKKLKIGKASGVDFLENEFIRLFLDELLPYLEVLFNKILEDMSMPEQWYESQIILLHKKGEKSKLNSYRPLSLSPDMRKIFMKIIKNRIYDQLDRQQPEEQAGFRRGYSTIDHIYALNQIIEKSKEYNIEIHVVFIDFRKAFDSIKHNHIIRASIDQGTDPKIVKIINIVYENSTAHIKLDKTGEKFKIKKGLAQDDPLSSNIFNAVLEWAFRNLDWNEKRINIIDGKRLSNLRFADDILCCWETVERRCKVW